jgi:hypothetical protein
MKSSASRIEEEDSMKLGVAMFATDYAIRPDDFARACEERGFETVLPFPDTYATRIAKVA